MADQFDRASELESLALQSAMNVQQRKAAETRHLSAAGYCLNPRCGEDFADPARLFCNPSCEREHARQTRN